MNPVQLLDHFDRISDAPDAIPRLRRFILDLAVRGMLVEQDPHDEPAAELLKRIQAEKARLVKAGEIRKEMPLPQVAPDEVPFGVPPGWDWVRIRQVTSGRGQTIPDKDFTYIDVTAINKEVGRVADAKVVSASDAPSRARKLVRTGDVLYSCVRPYLLNIAVIESDIVPAPIASTAFAVLNGFGLVASKYLWIVLRSSFMVECVETKMRGQAYPAINDQDFALLPLPLPPLAEQHRIVAKVDQLMALSDRLDAAQAERERRRNRLAAASLQRLNEPADVSAFREHAKFHLRHLARLTTRPDQIEALREAILNSAMRGDLVPQDPNDEPASRAVAKFAKHTSNGPVRRSVPETVAKPEFVSSWSLPSSWICLSAADMLRRGVIADLKDGNHGANHPKAVEFSAEGVPFITAAQVRGQTLDFAGAHKLSGLVLKRLRVGFAKAEDVIFTHKGSVGRVAIAQADCVLSPQTTYYRPNPQLLVNRYLMWFMASTAFAKQVDEVKRQTTRDFVPIVRQYEFFHAIPPVAEQRRIVAKVDELMAVCDRLEVQLSTTQTESRRLLEAVLHEALAPAV